MTRRGYLAILGGLAIIVIGVLAANWVGFRSVEQADYEFVAAWGGKGQKPGRFDHPTGVEVAGDEVFVSDSGNHRIQVFDRDGNFKRQFGIQDQSGRLGRPMNLAIKDSTLYIADEAHDSIQMYGLDGTPKGSIGGEGSEPGQFRNPGGVAVGSNGGLFVADYYNHRIQELQADGTFANQWGTTGEAGVRPEQFNYPTDVAVGPRNHFLYVADGYNNRVQVLALSPRYSPSWDGPSWFKTVASVAVDQAGNVFVADFYNHRVQKFNPDGKLLTSFGKQGNKEGEFQFVSAVATGDGNTIYVADFGNNRVQKWQIPSS